MRVQSIHIWIVLVSALLFLPFLGLVHLFDWDEINFAECAREMLISGNYARVQIEFLPFWEKPPLFFWLQAGAMQLFGINEYASRFPNAVIGIVTLLTIFQLGKKLYDQNFGLLWCLAYAGSLTPHFYFKAGIIDPLFNLCIFLSVFQLANLTDTQKKQSRLYFAFLGGVFMGLAILTKGPVAVLIVGLCGLVYWLMSKSIHTFKISELLLYAFMFVIVSSLWYLPEILNNGFWFFKQFIDYQYGLAIRAEDTGHNQPFWYHPVVLLIGCFPASIFFLKSFTKFKHTNTAQKNFTLWMRILFWVTLILFSIVKAKIIHYSSLCYFPLTFLAVNYIYQVWKGELKYAKWLNIFFVFLGSLIALALIIVPFVPKFKDKIIPYIDDAFAVANLQADVYWSGWESLIGIILLIGVVYAVLLGFRKNVMYGAIALFVSVLLTLQLTLYITVPKIERYSQGALIDFLKSKSKEDCYIFPLNFHSYAHHFYGNVSMENAKAKRKILLAKFGKDLDNTHHSIQRNVWSDWLLKGKIDKTAYLIAKIGKENAEYEKILQKIGEKNGFVFYKREK